MIDRRDDESGIGQRSCCVMVPAEPSDISVGDDNQRPLCPGDGAVLYADETIVDAHPKIAELNIFRLASHGYQIAPDKFGPRVEKLDAGGVSRRSRAKKHNN